MNVAKTYECPRCSASLDVDEEDLGVCHPCKLTELNEVIKSVRQENVQLRSIVSTMGARLAAVYGTTPWAIEEEKP